MASLFKRGNVFWVKYYRPGQRKPIRASLDTTEEAKARRKLKQLEGELAKGQYFDIRVEKIRFGHLLDLVLAEYRNSERKSIAQLVSRIEGADGDHGHIRPEFGDRRAITINTADISIYVDKRKLAGAKNATINRELDAINKAFRLGREAYKLPEIKFKKLREGGPRTGFLDHSQVAAICRRLPSYLADVVWFGFWTGWRISEIRALEWRNVDFEAGEIRLDTSKNEEGRVIKMTAGLRGLLEVIALTAFPKRTQSAAVASMMPVSTVSTLTNLSPCVFVRRLKNKKILPIGDFGKRWDKACIDAGLGKRHFHDLRRSAVRNFVRAGIPERVAMSMTGHRTRDVFERYNIVSSGDLEAAAKRLDEIAGTVSGTDTRKDGSK